MEWSTPSVSLHGSFALLQDDRGQKKSRRGDDQSSPRLLITLAVRRSSCTPALLYPPPGTPSGTATCPGRQEAFFAGFFFFLGHLNCPRLFFLVDFSKISLRSQKFDANFSSELKLPQRSPRVVFALNPRCSEQRRTGCRFRSCVRLPASLDAGSSHA